MNKALDSDEELEGMLQGGDLGNGSLAVSPSTDAWRRGGTTQRPSRKGKEKFKAAMEIIENAPNEYEAWVKITEEAAWVSPDLSDNTGHLLSAPGEIFG